MTHAEAREKARELLAGCSDSGCIVRARGGMRTNAGCRCRERLAEALLAAYTSGTGSAELCHCDGGSGHVQNYGCL